MEKTLSRKVGFDKKAAEKKETPLKKDDKQAVLGKAVKGGSSKKSIADKAAEADPGGLTIASRIPVNKPVTPAGTAVDHETVQKAEVLLLKPDNVVFDPEYNRREKTQENKDHIAKLSVIIGKDGGIRQPVRGYLNENGSYTITIGHSRVEAVKALAAKGKTFDIPLIAEDTSQTELDRTYDLVTSNTSKPLSMLEKSSVIVDLIAKGQKKKDIAVRIGETQANIDHLEVLSKATDETKQWIRDGKVSASSAIDIIRELGPSDAEKELKKLVAKNEKTTGKAVSKRDVKQRTAVPADFGIGLDAGEEDEDSEESGIDDILSEGADNAVGSAATRIKETSGEAVAEPKPSGIKTKDIIFYKNTYSEIEGVNKDKLQVLSNLVALIEGDITLQEFREFFFV